jgi:hypothetical protein
VADDDSDDYIDLPDKSTGIRAQFGDLELEVMYVGQYLTAEALETVLTRMRREIVAGARQLDIVPTPAVDAPAEQEH